METIIRLGQMHTSINQLSVNQSAAGLTAGIAGFVAPGESGFGFGANGIVQIVGNSSAECLDIKSNTTSALIVVGFYNTNGACGHILLVTLLRPTVLVRITDRRKT